jgi:hypothetical protein
MMDNTLYWRILLRPHFSDAAVMAAFDFDQTFEVRLVVIMDLKQSFSIHSASKRRSPQ